MDGRPMEVSSDGKTNIGGVAANRSGGRMGRDPRFEKQCGKYRRGGFQQSYRFLTERKQKEMEKMEEELSKDIEPERKERIGRWLRREKSRAEGAKARRRTEEILRRREQLESRLISQGKRPFYLTKRDKKRLLLHERFVSEGTEAIIEKNIKKRMSRQNRRLSIGECKRSSSGNK